MGGKGDGSRKMAAALAAAALAAFSGSGASRQGAASAARIPALLLLSSLRFLQYFGDSISWNTVVCKTATNSKAFQVAPYQNPIQVSAVEVYTPSDFPVENGTEAKLPCTFTSTEVISSQASVTWSFQGEGSSSSVSFFYYSNGQAYPGKSTQFDDRSNWAGDLNRKDASITIANMQFQDNGTYICDVKNPPDIVVTPGKIRVRVMEKGNLSVLSLTLVLGVTGVGILVLVFIIMLIVCVMIRKKNSKKHYSGCSTSESLMSPVKQAPRKSPSDTEVLVNSGPIRSHQGPVIYAQLDHSGGHYSDKINKSESVVYADIRKNGGDYNLSKA